MESVKVVGMMMIVVVFVHGDCHQFPVATSYTTGGMLMPEPGVSFAHTCPTGVSNLGTEEVLLLFGDVLLFSTYFPSFAMFAATSSSSSGYYY